MDLFLTGSHGLDNCRIIKKEAEGVPLLIIADHADEKLAKKMRYRYHKVSKQNSNNKIITNIKKSKYI